MGQAAQQSLMDLVDGKSVLFITTKNTDYIRNRQWEKLLECSAESCRVIGSEKKGYFRRLLHVYFSLLFCGARNYDVIFIGFAPQLILPWFAWKFGRRPVIMDFFISVYDTMIQDRRKWKDGGLCSGFCRWLDRSCIRRGTYVISDTTAHGDYFSQAFGVPRERIHTHYLEADQRIYYPREKRSSGIYTVLYFGSVLPLQGVPYILEAFSLLAGERRIRMEFIGPVPAKLKRPEAETITYINWLSQEELAEHIAKADLCIAGHFDPEIAKASRTIPGKAYIYESMKKKMILGDTPANHEIFSEDERHIFVPLGDGKRLAEAVKTAMREAI